MVRTSQSNSTCSSITKNFPSKWDCAYLLSFHNIIYMFILSCRNKSSLEYCNGCKLSLDSSVSEIVVDLVTKDISVHCQNCGLKNQMGKFHHNLSSQQPSLVLIKPSALKDAKDTYQPESVPTAVTCKMYCCTVCKKVNCELRFCFHLNSSMYCFKFV